MPRSGPRLSLFEAALLLCLLGTVLAIFVPSFVRRLRTNKITEASEMLEQMSARAAAYYATTWDSGESHCVPPAAGPTPPAPTVDAETVDFGAPETPGHDTWKALGFQPDRPVRYSYRFIPSVDGCGLIGPETAATISFRAMGDLDGDGVQSTFERQVRVGPQGWEPAAVLHVHQRTE